ncbi:MAG: hypothetical protein JST29_06465 [Bacteroidetes bacterium]|nr:hypothetical protein [Bacteroidota bacterium]
MKNKFAHLGRVLTREEAKLIVGGDALVDGDDGDNKCNVKCSTNSDCDKTCKNCEESTWNNQKFCVA